MAELTNIHAKEKTNPISSFKIADEISEDVLKGNHYHILLVEDNAIALKVLQNTVKKGQYTFQSATTGEEAFALATSVIFDLIITDIGLPALSGIELASLIRDWEKKNTKKTVPIIALTGHAVETAGKECFNAGINKVLTKPATLDDIQSLIKKLMQEQSF